ncbi:hypothetical protein TrVE_jg7433 [Triparma verrucosa]|nr:hypothetical protein TrST_g4000 [Triparma strigata]GMI13993.1 hypothetical protein TrVE_jg7433 [Triparma verrucosa]
MLSLHSGGLGEEWSKAFGEMKNKGDCMSFEELNTELNLTYSSTLLPSSSTLSPPVPGIKTLEPKPIYAGSIGQVHVAKGEDGGFLAVKVRYPGIADTVISDLDNLNTLINVVNVVPEGVFIDNIIEEGKAEVIKECSYKIELENHKRYIELIKSDDELVKMGFYVPKIMEELCGDNIIVSEWFHGVTIEEVQAGHKESDRICEGLMRLTFLELFKWRFSQTDPNPGNFLWDEREGKVGLIDFGGCREYDKEWMKDYFSIVNAASLGDAATVEERSFELGFLSSKDSRKMIDAHVEGAMILGEPFRGGKYDFKEGKVTQRIGEVAKVFAKERKTPPPRNVYTIHRKMAGAFETVARLNGKAGGREILEEAQEWIHL